MGRAYVCLMLLLCGGFWCGMASAADANPEQVLRSTTGRMRPVLERMVKDFDGSLKSRDLELLQRLHEDLLVTDLLVSERLRLRGNALTGNSSLLGLERHGEAEKRYKAAMSRVLSGLDALKTTGSSDVSMLETLRDALDELAPPRWPAIHGALPYRNSPFQGQLPLPAPQIVPAYRMTGSVPATAADLAGAPEAPVSRMIFDLAKTIAASAGRTHWDPAAIYNWVRENIRTEWYWGSMKGAEETLRQASGNDADQAALLVALLRASGYPARYVRGVAEFFPGIDAARSATGIDDPEQIVAFFRAAGIPCEAVTEGSAIVNLRIEHIWVEALVPYANYRGVEAEAAGKVWIPLDTSLKTAGFDEPPAIDLMSLPGHPFAGFRDRYLAEMRNETPLEMLRRESGQFLALYDPARSYAGLLHTRVQRAAALGILPSTLQFVDKVVTAEYSALPLELQHRVRLKAADVGQGGDALFDMTLPLRELSNRQVMLSFEPESVEDQETINRWGGLDNTPAYLVRLRPTLVVDEQRMVVAAAGLAPGETFELTAEFQAPGCNLIVSDQVLAGYPLSLGIVAQRALPPARENLGRTAQALLHRAVLAYVESWDRSESELAEVLDLALVRPMPTFAVVGGQLRVDELAGLPHEVEWEGLFLDAGLRVAEVLPRSVLPPERTRSFREISALEGSVLEHRLFESELAVESISTARLMSMVSASGLPLMTIDSGNAASLLPLLEVNESIKADIAAAVAAGEVVLTPTAEVTRQSWQGIGYIRENPLTGETGYMLSGGLAGGQTVLGRLDWLAEIAAIMALPFSGEPVDDPARAHSLAAITPPDVLLATAGEELRGALMVRVRDLAGTPVAGAPVVFKVRLGGGWLIDDRSQPQEMMQVQELSVVSGRDGIARARFVPGRSTFSNPVAFAREGDRYANIVGENVVDVQLAAGSLARLATPIVSFGFAGLPDPSLSRAYGNNLRGEVFGYSGDALVLLKDRYGNPVANQVVKFIAQDVEAPAGSICQNPPGLSAGQRDALLVADESCAQRLPVYGECSGAAEVVVASRSDGGAQAGVVLGGIPGARYPVTGIFTSHAGSRTVSWSHFSESFASCTEPAPPENRLVLLYQRRQDEAGRNVDARPAGQSSEILVKSWLLAEEGKVVSDGQTLSCWPSPAKICDMVAGTGAFAMMPPAAVVIAAKPAAAVSGSDSTLNWLYRHEVVLPAGSSLITTSASARRTMLNITNSCDGCGPLEPAAIITADPVRLDISVWGVDIEVPAVAVAQVDSQGIASHDLTFSFSIGPAQYVANVAQVLLYRNGVLWDTFPAGTSGTPAVVLPAGYFYDLNATYELQVLLNNAGDANEILSRKVPLLVRTTAVELQIAGLPSAGKAQAGAFVLLNNDFDEKDANPEVTLPDAATPSMITTDDELKHAWLLIDDSNRAQGGSWQVRASDPARLRIYHQKDGNWVEFKATDPPEPVAGFPAVIPLYLEGVAESAALRRDMLTASFIPAGGLEVKDAMPLTTIDLDMAVDGNRDRAIVFSDSRDERAYFWVNNDHDETGSEDGQTVEDDAPSGDDSADARISCKRDLEDFARLHVWLGGADASRALKYTLEMAGEDEKVQPMVNVFPAVNLSDGYLGLPSENTTPDQPDLQLLLGLVAAVGNLPVTLPTNMLEVRKNNYFIFEGRKAGQGRLVLTASYQDIPVVSREVSLELVPPASLYDHFVVSHSDSSDDSPVNPEINPEWASANASRTGSYQPASNEYVLFVHGWNMQPWEKKRWTETISKRLWWQGYQGKVGLFDWPCRTLPSWDFLINFDRSEMIAWQSAPALENLLVRLAADHSGQIRLLAHSQGNVVAAEALHQGRPGLVHTYIASQAALSASYFGNFPQISSDFSPKTPDVMSSYPADEYSLPYFNRLHEKVDRFFNYFNINDYALTGNSLTQPTWLMNNKTKPDNLFGYGYAGKTSGYPPESPDIGFYRSVVDVGSDPGTDKVLPLLFPENRYEIFSFCAQSWTCALGAERKPSLTMTGIVDLSGFSYDRSRYSHSRQFRSNIVDEENYWRKFFFDSLLNK
ncbi:MAG: alpha/beta hydrolase [Deltaproteobacteria bacterium]|nr:MAG: alpha/beta hydrolase [Deltaproteobacteria bacterium]